MTANSTATLVKFVSHDSKEVNKQIASISKRSSGLRKDIAIAAASVVCHAVVHGDVTLSDKLIKAMGDGWRLNALREWFIAFGPFVYNESDKVFNLDKAKRTELKKEYDADRTKFVTKLVAEPFYDFKPEPEFKPIDIPAMLKRALKQAEKAANDKANAKAHNLVGLNELRAIVAKLDA